ncbi:MAG: transposase [Candidatus Omnitrophota bacterium]
MGIFNLTISVINNFLFRFKPAFSKKQFIVFSFLIYALFKDYKRNSLYALASKTPINYQACQYFLSEGKWSIDDLNNIRLKIIEHQRTTSATSSGVLVIDDTSPKPFAKATAGAKRQHCGVLNREEICNVAVFSAFASKTKRFPINLKSYLPAEKFLFGKEDVDFKSKLDLAQILVDDALERKIKFSSLVIDAWYAQSSQFLEFVHCQRKLPFIGELKSNRNIFFYHPLKRKHCWIQQDELVKLIKKHYPHKCRFFTSTSKDGKKKSWVFYTFKGLLKDCSVPLSIVVIFGKWDNQDDKNVHILISNQTRLATKTIISTYLLRWGIELIFRELKDVFSFDQYQVRHTKQIERY